MHPLRDATMSGFNEYVDTLKRDLGDGRVYFSAITFDTKGVRKLQVGAPIKNAISLHHENYRPAGGTPLLDAVGKAILATEEVMTQQKGTKVIVVIQTDGEENASREYDLAQIKEMIETRQAKDWQFVFIGAGINAFADGVKMGIISANTMSYGADPVHTRSTFAATASNTRMFSAGLSASMNYSGPQSEASGEAADITAAKLNPKPGRVDTPTSISSLSLTS